MDILIISKYYGLINGASICTWELIKRWKDWANKVDVICAEKYYDSTIDSQGDNVFVHPLPNFNPAQIRAKCQEVSGNNTVIYGADDYAVFGKIKRLPFVITYHGNWPQALRVSPSYFLKGILHIPMYILNFIWADIIICPNYFHIPWVARFTDKSKTRMIRNGVRLSSLDIEPSISRPAILTVGNMDARKGKLLVEIIKILGELSNDNGIEWHLYIAGSLDYQPLKKLIDDRRIISLGFIANVADYVKEAEVFILASYMDLVSLAVTEAMALAKPVVCFDVGALSEVVSAETGALIPSFDVRKFALAILDLLSDDALRFQKGIQAQKAIQDFDWDKSAWEYFKIFQEISNSKN